MPKIYEYFGIVVYFYSNEHEPVHGRHGTRKSRAEIVLERGRVSRIEIGLVAGKRPLEGQKLKDFHELVENKADEIVQRWIDFFVKSIRVQPEIITRKLK